MLLSAIFASMIITSNVVAGKVLLLHLLGIGVKLPGSAFCYVITFFVSGLITEIWGMEKATKCVKNGIICQIIATAVFIGMKYIPAASLYTQEAYVELLGKNWWFVLSDINACVVSQFLNIHIFKKIRTSFESDQLRGIISYLSTIVSQFIDTFLFLGVAFGLGYSWLFNEDKRMDLLVMILCQYIIKVIISLVGIPVFNILTEGDKN